jgi:vitamin B12 transporter
MSVKVWGPYFLFIFLFVPAVCISSEENKVSGMEETKRTVFDQSKLDVEDLLMFWEEKDLFVQSATRNEKPISQVAENMTVITAKDIEDMNAHTVAEVLNRVNGLFVDFAGQDFGSNSLLYIQGSAERHVLVMLDGVMWNFMSSGAAETNSIPVKIIKRIEVVKGPASSAWGSSLGGVINIITKDAGDTAQPTGDISASIGEDNTQDDSAGISGKAGGVGYYVFAGRQESDGLRGGRYFDNKSLYSKFSIPLSKETKLGLSIGYSEPHIKFGDFILSDLSSTGLTRTFHAGVSLDAALSSEVSLNVSLNTFRQKFALSSNVLGAGIWGPAGDLFEDDIYDEKTTGGSGRLVWQHGIHSVVAGLDVSYGDLNQTIEAGQSLQDYGVPKISKANPGIDKWAVFANDTISTGKFSITPGIRFDHNSVTGSFTSPSLGATYSFTKKTILRTAVARGFTVPPLSWTSGGAFLLDPNPSLKPETVWSYQAGVESSLTDLLWVKATVFRHDLDDALEPVAGGPPSYNNHFTNKGKVKRQGFELEAETAPLYNISVRAGFAYVDKKTDESSLTNYTANIAIKYDDKRSFMTLLTGHYIWWDLPAEDMARYSSFIWDLNARKKIYSYGRTNTELFLTGHNIFSASQYSNGKYKNPGRWIEGGLRVNF